MVIIQHTWHTHYHGRRQRGEGLIGVHPPPPPHRKSNLFLLCVWPLSYFFSIWGPFLVGFSIYGVPFPPCEDLSAPFFLCRGLFATFFYLWGPFLPCEGRSAPFSPRGGLFCSHGIGRPFMGGRPCTLHVL